MRTWPSCSRTEKVAEFRARALNPDHPHPCAAPRRTRTSTSRAARLATSTTTPFRRSWKRSWTRSARSPAARYKLFDYVGAPDAEYVIVAMGSGCDAVDRGYQQAQRDGREGRPGEAFTCIVRSAPSASWTPSRRPASASPCSTAPRSPAPWASRSTSTSAPPCIEEGRKHRGRRRPLRPGLQGVHADPR